MGSAKPVTFWCTFSEFNLNMGEQVRVMNGKKVNAPKVIRFIDGIYTTSDPAEIAALRGCSIYGQQLHEEDVRDTEALEAAQEAFKKAAAKKPKGTKTVSKLAAAFTPESTKN